MLSRKVLLYHYYFSVDCADCTFFLKIYNFFLSYDYYCQAFAAVFCYLLKYLFRNIMQNNYAPVCVT